MNKEQHDNCDSWVRNALVLGGALACPHAALAAVTEADFLDEMPVVLSASRLSQPVNEAPAAVTVIDQDMIRASGFRDIPDLLRLVPGFTVAYTRDNTWGVGYHGLADALFAPLPGAGRRALDLQRGIMARCTGRELPLSIDDIERIEVVRGPNAATYGANAFLARHQHHHQGSQPRCRAASPRCKYGEHGMSGRDLAPWWRRGRPALPAHPVGAESRPFRNRHGLTVTDQIYEETQTYFVNGRADYRVSATDEVSAQFGLSRRRLAGGILNAARRSQLTKMFRRSTSSSSYRRAHSADDEWMVQAYHSRNNWMRRISRSSASTCVENEDCRLSERGARSADTSIPV